MADEKPISLALRSALARRDCWIEERTKAQLDNDPAGVEKAQRFVDEYDALIGLITADCPDC